MSNPLQTVTSKPGLNRWWLILLSLSVVGGLGYLIYWSLGDPGLHPRLTLTGHRGFVFSVACSPDGKTLASSGLDTSIKLWDLGSGKNIANLKGHTGSIMSVAFTPDGEVIVSGSDDKTVKLWDVNTRQELATLNGHTDRVMTVAVAPDGKTLASGSLDGSVILWDRMTREPIATLVRNNNDILNNVFRAGPADGQPGTAIRRRIHSLAFAPSGKTLAIGTGDGQVNLCDLVGESHPIHSLAKITGEVIALTFSADGTKLAAGSSDGRGQLWEVDTGEALANLDKGIARGGVRAVAFTPDGKMLACGGEKTVTLWDVVNESVWSVLSGHRFQVNAVTLTPNGEHLITGSSDRTIQVWEMAAIARDPPKELPNGSPPRSFEGSSDQLTKSVVVPTLDTPVPDGKSAIWCGAMQVAWNRLRSDVTRVPVRIENAEPDSDRLNRAEFSEKDLDPKTFYAAAGHYKDGIVQRIQQDMAARFPRVRLPQFDESEDGGVAFAYLEAALRFSADYFDNPDKFQFTDSAGKSTAVRSFGIRENEKHLAGKHRSQVGVLFRQGGEFALDLCRDSNPHQIVVAKLAWKGTLQATLADLEERAAKEQVGSLGVEATLLVPNLNYRVEHRFRELEGPDKRFLNPGLRDWYLISVAQVVQFKLDRSGAELASMVDTRFYANGNDHDPNKYHFDRPFLIYMKKRDAKRPFFVMWVANAELLCK